MIFSFFVLTTKLCVLNKACRLILDKWWCSYGRLLNATCVVPKLDNIFLQRSSSMAFASFSHICYLKFLSWFLINLCRYNFLRFLCNNRINSWLLCLPSMSVSSINVTPLAISIVCYNNLHGLNLMLWLLVVACPWFMVSLLSFVCVFCAVMQITSCKYVCAIQSIYWDKRRLFMSRFLLEIMVHRRSHIREEKIQYICRSGQYVYVSGTFIL